jgi:hypothetical protein
VLKWGLALIVIGAALAVPYFYRHLDERIRAQVESRLAKQYPGLKVTIRSATLVKNEGIEIRGVSIVERAADGPRAELLTYDECFLRCRTDLQDLLAGDLEVTQVTIRHPTLYLTRRPDGSWSAAKLLPIPKLSKRPPQVIIENGAVEIFDPLKNPSSTLPLREINLKITPTAGGPAAEDRKLQGTLSGDYFRHAEVEGVVDPHRPGFSLSGKIEGLDICPELRDALPGALAARLGLLETVRGQGAVSFRLAYDAAAVEPWQFNVVGQVAHGRIDDSRLPHPWTEVRAVVRLSNDAFAVEDLTARSNQAALRLQAHGKSLAPGQPLTIEAEVRQLEIDRRLIDVLPENLHQQWLKYRPDGQIDADARLFYDGQRWRPQLTVRCRNVSFTHYKFPYRLEHGTGTVTLADDVLQADLTASSGNQLVRVRANWRHPLSAPVGSLEIKGNDLPLDEKLLAALPERSRAVARALDLRGTVSFQYNLWRQSPEEKSHQCLDVRANRCWVRYEKFPYEVADVHGGLTMTDGQWKFHGLEGSHGATRVTCEGEMTAAAGGHDLVLRFRASDVPLEDPLRDALRPAMRQVWNDLRPRGMIDLAAEIRYQDGPRLLGVTVRVEPHSEITSIEPARFPYRLDNLQGVFTYCNGRVTMERLKAEHRAVKVAAAGSCDFLPDGGWHLRFAGLTVDRLRNDRDLMQAVPPRLKNALAEINPSGAFSLRGNLDLAGGATADAAIRSQWDLAMDMQQAGLDYGGDRLENVCGGLTLAGGCDGRAFYCRGELALDCLTYKDHQFTRVMGPLWIDDRQVLLGAWADRRQQEASPLTAPAPQRLRSLTASVYGGTVYGDGWVTLGAQPRWALHANLADGQLARWARENLPGRRNLQGRVMATLDLQGAGRSRNTLTGRGAIALRDANVYELPLMISMLKLLSIRAPDSNAFSRSDIDFRIQAEHVYFDRIKFTGDAISLLGKGEMNMQSQIHLVFAAIVGRGDIRVPVVSDFFTAASQQSLAIYVDGPLQYPHVSKEAFPGVKEAVQQLQSDLKSGGSFP